MALVSALRSLLALAARRRSGASMTAMAMANAFWARACASLGTPVRVAKKACKWIVQVTASERVGTASVNRAMKESRVRPSPCAQLMSMEKRVVEKVSALAVSAFAFPAGRARIARPIQKASRKKPVSPVGALTTATPMVCARTVLVTSMVLLLGNVCASQDGTGLGASTWKNAPEKAAVAMVVESVLRENVTVDLGMVAPDAWTLSLM